jgi:hypothetical protein
MLSIKFVSEQEKVAPGIPTTTSLIQPMDQGVTATFKSYYLWKTLVQLVKDTTDGKDQLSMKDIWKNFNIKKVTDNTGDAWAAWAEVSESCLNGVWRNIFGLM